ncbi:hypothetical protein BKP45_06885 [Anaerobacillus alkalidiazotrophicus]|uniref:Uncharacterized protein n=2 Tax=Anaerobacillus alkalidiazotrophicus TaxID=472963 RepID=A0A1S2MCQ6_9BACI|nr:hypothetical protein BKP45_06885 [Anaerobacillus alkalidiazotrophicus]
MVENQVNVQQSEFRVKDKMNVSEKVISQEEPRSYFDDKRHGVPKEFLEAEERQEYSYVEDTSTFVTSEQIKEKYETSFEQLQEEAFQKVSNLASKAIDEYANEENPSLISFYRTYYPKLKDLESEIDFDFEKMYKDLEAELTYFGYSVDKAVPFREQYEAIKQEKVQSLYSMLTN